MFVVRSASLPEGVSVRVKLKYLKLFNYYFRRVRCFASACIDRYCGTWVDLQIYYSKQWSALIGVDVYWKFSAQCAREV